jgi:photosystem II stability/assembly factor-like uncharacterized protein
VKVVRGHQVFVALSLVSLAALPGTPRTAASQQDPRLYTALEWRSIGPFRGGRTVAAVGVPGQPGIFYIGVNNGGVWKTTDYGRTWDPIFDDQPTGSIGAIAVAPSDPNVIYVGSGEGLQRPDLSVGDGIYKSTNGGRSWVHLGLRDAQQIAQIIVDPRDPNRVFVAVLGHPYGPNAERGVFRSTDGGATWDKVLYVDENTGAVDLVFDPSNARTVFAVMWAARQRPWEADGSSLTLSANNGIWRSTDGGSSWDRFGSGLPTADDGLGRIGLATSASDPRRMYAVVGARTGGGVYRSDDKGEHWQLVNRDPRLWGRDGDFNEVKVDPKDADVVYVANIVTWKSNDGGAHFTAFRGAPGGDDYHRIWVSPDDSKVILIAADQGAIITVNGGDSWSSWYNQPTAQFYHVITDNRFPYRVYGGQQESGSAWVLSRGNDGQITFQDWHPVGAEEYGYIAPDPLHPNLVFGGKVSRFDLSTGDVKQVSPVAARGGGGEYRFVRTEPLLFSPVDPHILYFAGNVLFKTLDGGESWTVISPDLTRERSDTPAVLGPFAALDPEHGRHRGVIYTIAPSFRNVSLIWVGTDDGLMWVTRDGGSHWTNVTPPALTPWSKVSLMEASHFDPDEAYAAVNRIRLDDLHPHIYRTKDGGRTWVEIVSGIPDDEVVNAVREDPRQGGLLFAGTERSVYVSFDDGDHWQPLKLNLPATSVRDLWIHEADLVAGTHGRGFWILDDITPLRQMVNVAFRPPAYLFVPATATRVRWDKWTDTPLPPDEPAGKNPPDGAIVDYWLSSTASGRVTLEVLDSKGGVVRRFSSDDPPEQPDTSANIPMYWVRPAQRLSAEAGPHRFVWDLRYAPPPASSHGYPISAIYRDTPLEPRGVWVMPGTYHLKLTVGGESFTQPLTVRMDPRVTAPAAALQQQFAIAMRIVDAWRRDSTAMAEVRAMRAKVATLKQAATGPRADSLAAFDAKLAALLSGGAAGGRGRGGAGGPAGAGGQGAGGGPAAAGAAPADNLTRVNGQLGGLYGIVEGYDGAPTSQALRAVAAAERAVTDLLARWDALKREGVALGVPSR